jgi:hypothetical protein
MGKMATGQKSERSGKKSSEASPIQAEASERVIELLGRRVTLDGAHVLSALECRGIRRLLLTHAALQLPRGFVLVNFEPLPKTFFN